LIAGSELMMALYSNGRANHYRDCGLRIEIESRILH
jgi:hypothetical protein